jgi:hypothetical protein
MAEHKFKIGQRVYFNVPANLGAAQGFYYITAHLPADGGQFQYRIKSAHEAHERVAKEGQLIPILTLSNPWLPSRGVRWT